MYIIILKGQSLLWLMNELVLMLKSLVFKVIKSRTAGNEGVFWSSSNLSGGRLIAGSAKQHNLG